MSAMEGKTVNGYTLKSPLGKGGMAEVWLAENEIGMQAAVKILSDELSRNEQMQDRFLNEAKVMVKLDHPNIRKVYGYGKIDGRPCIIMEYLDGNDLKARLKRGQRFTDEELQKWWNQLVDALNYTHAQNVVHRDIKPSNIFIDRKGNVKLLDFGIAKVADTTSGTLTGSTLGTRIYMSPEQVRDPKRVGTKSDVYSLAVSFVHLLTGKAPYDSTTSSDYDIQVSIVTKPIDLSPLPQAWQGFLAPYLEKDPEKRPELRPFEAVPLPEKPETPQRDDVDEGTVVDNMKKPEPKPVAKPTPKPQPQPVEVKTPEPTVKPKSKKGLWIGLGLAAAAIVALIAIIATPKSQSDNKEKDLVFDVNGVSFVMKPVEGGTFQMGLNMEQGEDVYNAEPVHDVTVSSYYLGETEVTQALWTAVMGTTISDQKISYYTIDETTPSREIINMYYSMEKYEGDDFPMCWVSWNDCRDFIRKLNQLTGKQFRLPTEAEWEFAARGGNLSNGYVYSGSDYLDEVAWSWQNCGDEYLSWDEDDLFQKVSDLLNDYAFVPHTVKTKLPNELGLYDMSCNVTEWCYDYYDEYSSGSQTNPTGPSEGKTRVLRGGSCYPGWMIGGCDGSVECRDLQNPEIGGYPNGFRLCLPK